MADLKRGKAADERRDSPRLPMTFRLLDLSDKNGTWMERDGDLSLGGIHWHGSDTPHGVAIDVRFRLPNEPYELHAHSEILRIMGRGATTHVHARFTDLDLRSELAIARYLDDEMLKKPH